MNIYFSGYNVVSFPITDQFSYDEEEDPMALATARSQTNLSELTIPENETSTSGNR